jgi:ATP-dependent exoDNAse (exonuclease V) beta subunit
MIMNDRPEDAGPAARRPRDDEARRQAMYDLGTTFLVEAGAGSGKTRVLVERYVSFLRRGLPIESVVAITFTDKAAGELRQRIRARVEELLMGGGAAPDGAAPPPDPDERDRLAAALPALERAPISTIHSFAARLLRERPIEAGVDPAFRQLDATGSQLLRERLWDDWLAVLAAAEGAGDDNAPAAALGEVLAAGAKASDVRELAFETFAQRHALDVVERPGEPRLAGVVDALAAPAAEMAAEAASCLVDDDRLCVDCRRLGEAVDALPREGDIHELGSALLAVAGSSYGSAGSGRSSNWPRGKERMHTLRAALLAEVNAAADSYREYVADLARFAADGFARWAAAAQNARGVLDFDDLLGKARDLLRGDARRPEETRALRRSFGTSYRAVLVDEFQDTDPLQAELVFFLCEAEPAAGEWHEVVLAPGKLFLVGDPKQSIYRFRRADITMYHRVKDVVVAQGGRVLDLHQNFRTVAPVIDWINEVFRTVIGADEVAGLQPRYEVLDPWRGDDGHGAAVAVLRPRGEVAVARADERRTAEAALVAGFLCSLPDLGWTVGVEGRRRPATFGDVMVLCPVFTAIDLYEDALREAGIAYRVEGGRTYFLRPEVVDVVGVLRAVGDPGDPVALYGALHTSLFGFSDDDLFAFHAASGRFDCFAAQPDGHDAVRAALSLVRDLHERRDRRPLVETVDDLLRRTALLEVVAAGSDDADQVLANLEKLLTLAAEYDDQAGVTFHAFVAALRDAMVTADEAESVVGEDADVVRVMTVHKAKGLEFPIVVLANATGVRGRRPDPLVVDRDARRLECSLSSGMIVGEAGAGKAPPFASRGYAARCAYETDALEKERRRLLYVALTRAADHLVLPVVRAPDESGRALLDHLAGHLDDDVTGVEILEIEAPPRGVSRPAPPPPDLGELVAARESWVARRERVLADTRRAAPVVAPSGLERLESDAREPEAQALRRSEALAVGSAVHRVMEEVALDDPAAIDGLATLAAAEQQLPQCAGRVAVLARGCWLSPVVREAAKAEHHRELPVRHLEDEVVVEGSIDLAFRRGDGWVIVDYKTDAHPDPERMREHYESQVATYVLAFEAASGERVDEAVLVLAGGGDGGPAPMVALAVVERLRDAARAAIAAAATQLPVEAPTGKLRRQGRDPEDKG